MQRRKMRSLALTSNCCDIENFRRKTKFGQHSWGEALLVGQPKPDIPTRSVGALPLVAEAEEERPRERILRLHARSGTGRCRALFRRYAHQGDRHRTLERLRSTEASRVR